MELVSGDIAQRQTLLPENFQGIRGLIVCSSAIVTPKEGDTEDRKKYYQVSTPDSSYVNTCLDVIEKCEELVPNLLGLACDHHGNQV